MSERIATKFDFPLYLTTHDYDGEHLLGLNYGQGPVAVYFWFTPEQALALSDKLKEVAQQLNSSD